MEERMPTITTFDQSLNYGKFIVEPFERGYGNTLGSALRRILLSSIPGAAITAIRIDKVLHEFSKIEGVKEDANQLLLNLKDIAVKIVASDRSSDEEYTLRLEVQGPGRVTGADIQCPPEVEIVNPEVYIATISDPKTVFAMDLYVGLGCGFVMPNKSDVSQQTIGVIPLGAQYTPVRKVNYIVEATRVGNRTDFERMVLEVWTNGTLAPPEAVSQAAQILERYVRLFMDLAQFDGASLASATDQDIDPALAAVPDTRIEGLDFSQRTFNCLRRANLLSLRELAQVSEIDLINIRGFGRKSLLEVKDKLASFGLSLRPSKNMGRNAISIEDFDDDLDE